MSWQDWIFGNLPPQPVHPASRGALLGARYQSMPDTRSTITDNRNNPYSDHAAWMKNSLTGTRDYAPSMSAAGHQGWSDPMLGAGLTLSEGVSALGPNAYDPYKDSFKMNWRPSPYNRPAPYNPFRMPRPYGDEYLGEGRMGPDLPRGPVGTSVDPEMPYMGQHLPIAPGDPGWTPPPSPSGPHNRAGDLDRPGYASPEMPMDFLGMTLNSQGWR